MERKWSRKDINDYCQAKGIKYFESQENSGIFELLSNGRTGQKLWHGPYYDDNPSQGFFIDAE